MIEITLHGRNGTRTIQIKSPRGVPTRHVRTRQKPDAEARHHDDRDRVTSEPAPQPEPPPVPACPILAALRKLTDVYPDGDNYFIFDEIFVTVRQECTLTRDTLLETLRSYYRDGKIAFRRGYGSQLQFALKGETE